MKLAEIFKKMFEAIGLTEEQKTKFEGVIKDVPDVELKEMASSATPAGNAATPTGSAAGNSGNTGNTGNKSEREKELEAQIAAYAAKNAEIEKRMNDFISAQTAASIAKKVDEKIQEAIKSGRLPGGNEEVIAHHKKLLTADFETASKIIDLMPQASQSRSSPQSAQKGSSGSGSASNAAPALQKNAVTNAVRPNLQSYLASELAKSNSEF